MTYFFKECMIFYTLISPRIVSTSSAIALSKKIFRYAEQLTFWRKFPI